MRNRTPPLGAHRSHRLRPAVSASVPALCQTERMTSRPSFLSANSRNRLIAAALLGAAGGAAWIVRSKRPLPREPAPEPPRIGHTREVTAGAAPTPAVAPSHGATAGGDRTEP